MDERGVSKGGAQTPLLAEQLLVRHGVDGVGEGKCWADGPSR